MDLKWFIICVFVSFLNTVSCQHKFMYKPTDFPYSRCTYHYPDRITCENLNITKERREKKSVWPPGPYAIPMSKYGCPESQSRGWFKSLLKVNMIAINSSSDSYSTDYNRESERNSLFVDDDFFKPPFKTEDVKLYFCVKFRNETKLDQGQWIPGNYSVYKIGQSCPLEFEESSRTLPITDFVSYGIVPNIEASREGQSKGFINISMCKRVNRRDIGNTLTNVTFSMFETDFILEKDPDTNCLKFNDSSVSEGATHCFYYSQVENIDHGTEIDLILNQYFLTIFHKGRI
ncbi:uncharacterized protein LOC132729959 [Ruditapes philippinarum]|uniref:uncharacterized protein LOC132729959 n=1 Tax=Ruditapes philippinarum TaxID=129788 RepID=UPI00295B8426|nr:uncharacterized protein LOC132729959 [Ruditapes philippinarum]